MKFRFPIVIIDEDFRSENASGLGIRALADAIEKEGVEVLGVITIFPSLRSSKAAPVPLFCPSTTKNSAWAARRKSKTRFKT
jgi:hypothetical protein